MNPKPAPCPRPDLLIALEEGVLPETLAAPLRSHIAGCQFCARLRQDLNDPALAEPTLAEVAAVRLRVFGTPRPSSFRWRWIASIAAALVLTIGLFYWQRTQLPAPQIARQTIPPPPAATTAPAFRLALQAAPLRLPFAAVVIRGSEGSVSEAYLKELGAALDPYRARRFDKSAERMAALRQKYPRAVEPPFYQGVSELLRNQTANAMEPLKAARDIGGEALSDDIDWYLAITHERSGEWSAAEPLLARLCNSEGHHRNAACAAIRK